MSGLQASFCALVLWAGTLAGQTLTTGAIAGTVRGPEGQALTDVSLTLVDAATGSARSEIILPGGSFQFAQLTPGQYELLAERVGYRPKRVVEIPVRPVTSTRVDVTLAPAPPPVGEADVEQYAGLAMAAGGTREWLEGQTLRSYPDLRRELSQVGRLSSLSASGVQMEGLPGWMTGVVVDGIPTQAVRHPALANGSLRTAAFPLGSMESAELVTNGLDVEWPGSAGGLLSGYTLRGSRQFQARGYGAWSGGVLGTTSPVPGEAGSPKAMEGGFILGGPLAGDSAHVLVGLEARRVEQPLGAAWAGSSAAAVQSAANQGLGIDLGSYLQSRTARSDVISGFARVDWQVTPVHAVDLRASVASIPSSDPAADETWAGILPLTSVKGSDLSLGATLRSLLGPTLTSEFRLGVDRGTRDYTNGAAGSPYAMVTSEGFSFGGDPGLPGSFTQTTVRFSGALQAQAGDHDVKFGGDVAVPKYDQAYLFGESGQVFFGSVAALAARDGLFVQPTGPAPQVSFSVPAYGLFVQDRWSPLPGLDLLGGVRAEAEQLPRSDVLLNTSWQHLTSLANTSLPRTKINLSPRGGLVWDLGLQGRYILEVGGGLFYDPVDPAVLGQLIADNGRIRVRRGAGVITGWPVIANATTASSTASSLTLLSAGFRAPRTARGTGAFTIRLGDAAKARISGVIRHTEFLARASDLNLPVVPIAQDQYGRPVYGTLIQKASLVAALPGSNRRFPDFDAVTAFTSDGVSDYRAVTFSLERPATRSLGLMVGYTFSSATDNWLGSGAVRATSMFDPGLGSGNTDWASATSDLDVPQRFVAGATLAGPAHARLSALFRYASGRVFTPGFAAGVDANGDGVAGNDPAFVSADVSGAGDLINQWSCLRTQVGAFAARNSCRGPAVKRLDARLAIPLFSVSGSHAELRVDALDLLDSGVQLPDPALYLVNPAGSLTTDASGHVNVPLVANPHFGKALGYGGSGRTLLLGLALNW